MVLDFLAVDNFDFTRKNFGEKLVKMLGWGFVKIEFLDKNLTFRIVCLAIKVELQWNTRSDTYVLT